MSTKWFCNNCHSLNARGARRCYSCGEREDYLGLDGKVGAPPVVGKSATDRPTPPNGTQVVAGGAADGSMEFADDAHGSPRKPLGRTSRRGLAALAISAAVLVALIGAVAVLGIGRGPDAGAPSSPGASPSPGAPLASTGPSAASSPVGSGGPSLKPMGSGASPDVGTPAPTQAPLATDAPLATEPPLPVGSPLPADQLAAALVRLVRGPSFTGHVDVTAEYRIDGVRGTATGDVDFSGSDLRAHQVIRFPSLHESDEAWLIVSRDALYTRTDGPWQRVYVLPAFVAGNVLDQLQRVETLGTPTPATGADRGLWSFHWPQQETYGRTLLQAFDGTGWQVGSMTVMILVRPDGVPVRVDLRMLASRTVSGQAQTFGVTSSWTYSAIGSNVIITVPVDGSGVGS